MATAYDIYQRPPVWDSKDTVPRELQFIQPLNASRDQVARVMVSPRLIVSVTDGASVQTAAISSATNIVWTANAITPGAFPTPPAGAGVLWEGIRASIAVNDTSAKLQITLPCRINLGTPFDAPLAFTPALLPFTMPAITSSQYVMNTVPPMPIWLPSDGSIFNGPVAQLGLVNTDSVATHPYIRLMGFTYRYIFDIDYTKEKVYVCGTLS